MAKTSREQARSCRGRNQDAFSLVGVDRVYLCYATLNLMLFVSFLINLDLQDYNQFQTDTWESFSNSAGKDLYVVRLFCAVYSKQYCKVNYFK